MNRLSRQLSFLGSLRGLLRRGPSPLARSRGKYNTEGVIRRCKEEATPMSRRHEQARLEREKGFEPSTLALARRCSTTELFPLEWNCEERNWILLRRL